MLVEIDKVSLSAMGSCWICDDLDEYSISNFRKGNPWKLFADFHSIALRDGDT